jgi:hypothetical protein
LIFAGVLLLMLASCATTSKLEDPPPVRPDERSSIDILLRHRGELQLTDAQVARLEELETKREAEARALREQLEARKHEHKEPGVRPDQSGTAASNSAPPGMSNRGMGGGAGRGQRGPSMGRGQGQVGKETSEMEHLIERIDEADTRAFVDAHAQVLTEAQRPAAEKLASDFRARLFDYREAMHKLHPHVPEE